MPNQRKDTKRHMGLWLEPEEIEQLKKVASEKGLSVADVIRESFKLYEQQKNTGISTDQSGSGDDRKRGES